MGSKPHIAALSSTVIGVLDFLINFFIAIITVPIFLGYWGTQKYGLWLMLQASFGIFQFFDFGLRTYAGYEINLRFGKDPEGSKAFLASTLLFVVCLSIIPIIFSLFLLFNPTLGEFFFG